MQLTRLSSLTVVALLCLATSCQGLSFPMCKYTNQVWGTQKPSLGPSFPYADLWFFCQGGLNIGGQRIHSCINNGKECGKKAADLVCQYMGFDMADITSTYAITSAPAGVPAKSMSGEWCINKGVYDATKRTAGKATPCQIFESLTCVRKANKFKQLPKPTKIVDNRKISVTSIKSTP